MRNEQGKPTNEPNGRPQYYVSECPDTKRQFLVEHGKDNNVAELTMENVETIRRLFLPTPTGNARRQSDLYDFLAVEYKRYRTEILPLHPDGDSPITDDEFADGFEKFDAEKNEFLESLYDVISQHFDDKEPADENNV